MYNISWFFFFLECTISDTQTQNPFLDFTVPQKSQFDTQVNNDVAPTYHYIK